MWRTTASPANALECIVRRGRPGWASVGIIDRFDRATYIAYDYYCHIKRVHVFVKEVVDSVKPLSAMSDRSEGT